MAKRLEQIKHGHLVVSTLSEDKVYFVDDIRRQTGLDPQSMKRCITALHKHGYLEKNSRGQWHLPRQADIESAVVGGPNAPASEARINAL